LVLLKVNAAIKENAMKIHVTVFGKHDEHGMPNTFRCDGCEKDFYYAESYLVPSGMKLVDPYEYCQGCFDTRYHREEK